MVAINYPGAVKMLRETLCEAQSQINNWMPANFEVHAKRLQALIDECDRHRPLGPDGTHGNRHTATCGCEDRGHGEWCPKGSVGGPGFWDDVFFCSHPEANWDGRAEPPRSINTVRDTHTGHIADRTDVPCYDCRYHHDGKIGSIWKYRHNGGQECWLEMDGIGPWEVYRD